MNAIKKDESSGDSPCVFKERTIHLPVSYGILSKADGWLVLGDDGSLLSVQISGSKGEMLAEVEVLEAKYGKPSKTTTQVENKMGTKFDKDIFVWQDSQGSRITVESMYDKIDEGRIVIESASTVAVEKEAEKVKKKIGKLNL